MAQFVFQSWLKTHSCGTLETLDQEKVFLWLFGMNPGLAEAEYRILLMEISWLESFTGPLVHFTHEGDT